MAAGLMAGGAIGFLTAKKMLEVKYETLLQEEIEKTQEYYRRFYKKDGFETPEEAAATLGLDSEDPVIEEETESVVVAAAAMRSYRGAEPKEHVAKVLNIFKRTEENHVDDEETEQDVPVVISRAAFDQNNPGHSQSTITYFQADETLVDERSEILDDIDELVGLDNLQRFGHKSGDPNVVLVRNDRFQMDFEILLSTGSYSEEVLGQKE